MVEQTIYRPKLEPGDIATQWCPGSVYTGSLLKQTANLVTLQVSRLDDEIDTLGREVITSSGITLEVIENLERCGIDLQDHEIKLTADKTTIIDSSQGGASELQMLDYQGNKQWSLGATTSGAIMWFRSDSDQQRTHLDNDGIMAWDKTGTGNYAGCIADSSKPELYVGRYIGTGNYHRLSISIDSNGKLRMSYTKNGTKARASWPSESDVSSGEVYCTSDGTLKVKS